MKQILALMTIFLILMLTITTVMAVGNVKQSQQMAHRMQLISSLRADLRSAKQEQETLNTQLECERATSRTLRTERNALSKRYDHLMTLLRNQPVGYTDVLPASISWTSPLIPPLTGECWLQAQALERLLNDRQSVQIEAEAALAATDQRLQETMGAAKKAGEGSIFSVASSVTATIAPRDTLPPAMAATTAQATTIIETPVARQTPTASTKPATTPVATTSAAADSATATVAPRDTLSPAIAATASPPATVTKTPVARQTPSTTPLATATFPPLPVATLVPAQPTETPSASPLPAPTPVPREKNLLQSALITGLDTLQHWLHKLDAAIDHAIDQLQPTATYHP